MKWLSLTVPVTVLIVAVFLIYGNLKEATFHEKNLNSEQNKIVVKGDDNLVLAPSGKLNHIGWAKNPLPFKMNPEFIRASTSIAKFVNPYRYKKWEYYLFTSKDFMFGFAVFDFAFIKGHILFFSDLEKPDSLIKKIEQIGLFNNAEIPDTCVKNCISAKYSNDGSGIQSAEFRKVNPNSHSIKLKAVTADINLEVDVKIDTPTKDSDHYVGFVPISEDSTSFFFTTKTNLLLPKGVIKINNKEVKTDDFMVLHDSGRGVWPVRSGWIWASANGKTKDNSSLIGFNFGHGFSHPASSRSTEDIFFVDGKGFKLSAVKTILPNKLYDEAPDLNSFVVDLENQQKEGENYCSIKFKIKRRALFNKVYFFLLNVRIVISYGNYVGRCVTNDGKVYEFDEVYGILEHNMALW